MSFETIVQFENKLKQESVEITKTGIKEYRIVTKDLNVSCVEFASNIQEAYKIAYNSIGGMLK